MATIKDVAAQAGVSVASVSRAINDPASVAPATLARINAVISRIDFAPNKLARSLKVQTTRSVAVVVPDIANPFHLKVIRGAESVLDAAGYTLFLLDTEEDAAKETRSLRDLLARQIDGVVYVPVLTNQSLPPLLRPPVPVVVVDRWLGGETDTVRSDAEAGLSLLVGYLASRGRRRLAWIGGPDDTFVGRERTEAFRALLPRHGLEIDEGLLRSGAFTREAGHRLARELWAERPDALVLASNLLGLGALRALRELGLRVGRDLEVAVFDEVGELADPVVPHLRQQAFEMGAQAARFLLERLAGYAGPPRRSLFQPVLSLGDEP